jgi:hypothetical protein
MSDDKSNGDTSAVASATVLQFPASPLKPNLARLLPLLNAIPDGSTDLVKVVILGASALDAEYRASAGGSDLSQDGRQGIADALFIVYWSSARLLGMAPKLNLGPEDLPQAE